MQLTHLKKKQEREKEGERERKGGEENLPFDNFQKKLQVNLRATSLEYWQINLPSINYGCNTDLAKMPGCINGRGRPRLTAFN